MRKAKPSQLGLGGGYAHTHKRGPLAGLPVGDRRHGLRSIAPSGGVLGAAGSLR